MRRIPTFVVVLALAGIPSVVAGQGTAPGPDAPSIAPAAADEATAVYDYGDRRPGQSQKLPRGWTGAPALIPHAIKGLTPITAKRNACAGCHGRPGATSGPPSAPPSHFVDTREAPGTPQPKIAASRWNCTACHVPQTNAPPLTLSDGVPRP